MNKFEKVKIFYEKRLWSKKRVRDAVIKGWISGKQYKEITGEEYSN